MRIIICGAGQVGWQIARQLSRERHDIVLIDRDERLIQQANDALDVQGITGHASHPDVLERAGAEDCDLLIAATASDEVNIVACQVAHALFSVPRRFARLRGHAYLLPQYADLYQAQHLPIDVVISPEQEVAQAALSRLDVPTTLDTETFMDGRVRLLAMALTEACPVLNTPLRHLDQTFFGLRAVVVGLRGNAIATDVPNPIRLVVVAPCRCFPPPGGWQDTAIELPAGRFRPHLAEGPAMEGLASASELFAGFPVALLSAEAE